ncbi:MAG: hypothetical protein IJD56_05840 [Peptococcaceae bacterium]|nr:hypothetical protein [Peptococcaceae bacterium]
MMNFDELLAVLGNAYENVTVYSVEDREMTTHETAIVYFFEEDNALHYAESIWAPLSADEREYREISVHRGEIQYLEQNETYRFLVHNKLFKAYKKVYVTQEFANAFREKQKAQHLANGMSDEDASAQAKKDFNAEYAVQPVIKFGMFAGYNYAPGLNK